MSYAHDRDQFVATMTTAGLPMKAILTLLRAATTLQRLGELACNSEAADNDRIPCPASHGGPCLCDRDGDQHRRIPRIRLQDHRAEQRAHHAVPNGWRVLSDGDPRGCVLRVMPPNQDAIGVPARESRR